MRHPGPQPIHLGLQPLAPLQHAELQPHPTSPTYPPALALALAPARHELQQQQQHLQQQRCAAAAAAAAARRAPPPRDNVASLVERFMDNRRRRQQTIDAHLDEVRRWCRPGWGRGRRRR